MAEIIELSSTVLKSLKPQELLWAGSYARAKPWAG
jgi:hypothetical protein